MMRTNNDIVVYAAETERGVVFRVQQGPSHQSFLPDDSSQFDDAVEDFDDEIVYPDQSYSLPAPCPAEPAVANSCSIPFVTVTSSTVCDANQVNNQVISQSPLDDTKFHLRKLDFLAEVASSLDNNVKHANSHVNGAAMALPLFERQGDSEKIVPAQIDVIFGKGGRLKHPGNELFRAECQRLAPQFLQNPTSANKHEVAKQLVNFIHNRGGRFLIEDSSQRGVWKLADFNLAWKKARQLLADAKKKSALVAALQQQEAKKDKSELSSV